MQDKMAELGNVSFFSEIAKAQGKSVSELMGEYQQKRAIAWQNTLDHAYGRTSSDRCAELAKLANIRRMKAILRSPFSWAPRLVIWAAYWLTTPLKDDVIYDDGEYGHPTEPLLRRAGL